MWNILRYDSKRAVVRSPKVDSVYDLRPNIYKNFISLIQIVLH